MTPPFTETPWLSVHQGTAPLLISLPHTGTMLPHRYRRWPALSRTERALRDTDWYIEQLYEFAAELGASSVRTGMSRSGHRRQSQSLRRHRCIPGQATTELCPTTTFDGDPLYHPGREPDAAEIAMRRTRWFDPYHAALEAEIARMRGIHSQISRL